MKQPSALPLHRKNVLPFCVEKNRERPQLKEFLPFYQPIVDLHTGCVAGLELLARWNHPTAGLLSPDDFITDAEKDGWISELTYALLERALVDMGALPETICLSINLSPLQLLDCRLGAKLEQIAQRARFPLRRLKAEITETALVQDQACALAVARDLKARGCKLSLDDFGTGYSSLFHLQSLPFDEIKVDRSFIASMLDRKECRKIVSAVIGLGRSLGISTVGEGIEDPRQVEMLTWLGCDLGQGWLYGRPMQAEALPCFLQKQPLLAPASATGDHALELETSAERIAELRALYDGAPVSLAFLDTRLRYRNLNQHMAEMNGLSVQDHLGRHVREVLPALFPSFLPYLQRALAGEAVRDVELTFLHPVSGKALTRWISYQPARDEAGDVIGISVAVVDATTYKQRQTAGQPAKGSLTCIKPLANR